ncbi:hypothetical protein D3C85_1200540 [compost metagenome]
MAHRKEPPAASTVPLGIVQRAAPSEATIAHPPPDEAATVIGAPVWLYTRTYSSLAPLGPRSRNSTICWAWAAPAPQATIAAKPKMRTAPPPLNRIELLAFKEH